MFVFVLVFGVSVCWALYLQRDDTRWLVSLMLVHLVLFAQLLLAG